jgi:hypothetical protein
LVRAVADAVAVGWDAQQQGKGKRLAGEMKKWQKLAKSGVMWREAARKARQNRVQTSLLGSFRWLSMVAGGFAMRRASPLDGVGGSAW